MDIRRSEGLQSIKKRSSDRKSHDHVNENMIENSNGNKSCKVISKLLLPEDLIIYIFTFVPLTCLFKSAKYVCKSWAMTIRSSHFAELYERQARSKPGLYVDSHSHLYKISSYFLEFKDNVNGQFERTDLGIPQIMGQVIGTCDGLLLLCNGFMHTYIVNPILKCCLRIPPFLSSSQYLARTCIITRVPRTAKFKLFHVNVLDVSGNVWYVCYVLRIGIDNSWKEIARKQSMAPNISIHWQGLRNEGNDLYWITDKEVIVMDVDREIILREYPVLHLLCNMESYLLMGNRLSCILPTHISRRYAIYLLDFDSGKWSLNYNIRPIDIAATCGRKYIIMNVVFRLWINDHIIFRVAVFGSRTVSLNSHSCIEIIHFCYNVKTKQSTRIEGIDVGDCEVWFHTNSLVTLPSSPA